MIPIYMAPPDSGHIPHKYIVLHYYATCDGCGTTHEWTQVMAETRLTKNGKYLGPNHRSVDGMNQVPYNLPTEIRQAPQPRLPFCHLCHRPGMLSHLPDPPLPPKEPLQTLLNHPLVKAAAKHTPWQDKRGNVHMDSATESDDILDQTPKMRKASLKRKYTVDDL